MVYEGNIVKIKIIGAGVVGQNMKKIFPEAFFHDPRKGYVHDGYTDLAFICVPTESREDGSCNTDIVKEVLRDGYIDAGCYCIKSTVPPGFTDNYLDVCFSPEYYGGTIHANEPGHDFLIVGGDSRSCDTVVRAYREHCHPSLRIYKTDAKTAELVKYMENSFLALKVVFCNEFAKIAQKIGVDYDLLRELFLADSRVGRSHTWVYDDKPGYDSHCLNKDIPALLAFCREIGYNGGIMEAVDRVNTAFKAGEL
jgi:UDPglucose 6-dehydrogenase